MPGVSAHSGDRTYAQSLHLVPPSTRRPHARRKRAPLQALHLPLLRARRAKARCQSARRTVAAHETLGALPRLDPPCFRYTRSLTAPGAPRLLLAARDGAATAKVTRAAGRPAFRCFEFPPLPSRLFAGLASPVGSVSCLLGIGLAAGMLSPLMAQESPHFRWFRRWR